MVAHGGKDGDEGRPKEDTSEMERNLKVIYYTVDLSE